MYRGLLTVLFIVVVITVSIQKGVFSKNQSTFVRVSSKKLSKFLSAMAIKCWRCSSDAANAKFCADPFEPLNRNFVYVECSEKEDHSDNMRAVCKKAKKLGNYGEFRTKLFSVAVESFVFLDCSR